MTTALHPYPGMPVAAIFLNLLLRCTRCTAAMDGPFHADSGLTGCGWVGVEGSAGRRTTPAKEQNGGSSVPTGPGVGGGR